MTRDMDLVRALLLKLEALPIKPGSIVHITSDDDESFISGYSFDQVEYHAELIREAGFIDDGNVRPMVGFGFRRLTWEGHDFLDSIRDPAVWAKTKKGVADAGGFTLDLLKDLAKGFLKRQIEERTGVKF